MTTIHTILNKAKGEFPKPDASEDDASYFYSDGWHDAIEFIRAEVDTAVVSVHDPIAGAIGSVEYDKWRIITEAGFLVANVRVFDFLKHENEFTVEEVGQWIADAINEKISGAK